MNKLLTLGISFVASCAWAQDDARPLQINGFFDAYYAHNFTRSGRGLTLNGRSFDVRNEQLDLAFAELDFVKATKPNGFGFTANLYGGKGADILSLTEPGGRNKYKWIRQAYVTYQTADAQPLTIDFGKFDTWIGYETIDNRYQDQYSRSFNTTFSEPAYETGLRLNKPLSPKLSGAFYLVQGWSETEDGNDAKSWGISLFYSPDSTTTITLQNHSGEEGSDDANDIGTFGGFGFATPGTSHVDLFNLVASKQLTAKTKVALTVDCGRASNGPNKGNWNGEVLYVRHQMSDNQAASLRFDRFEDKDGLRTGVPVKLYSLTGGYDRTLNPNFTLRFELRHDIVSDNLFLGRNGNLDKNRTTFTVGAIGKF